MFSGSVTSILILAATLLDEPAVPSCIVDEPVLLYVLDVTFVSPATEFAVK